MKFDVFFTLRSSNGDVEVPNKRNPIESDDIKKLVDDLAQDFPLTGAWVDIVGVRVVQVVNGNIA